MASQSRQGRIYFRTPLNPYWTYAGIVESVDLSGSTGYDINVNISALDKEGFWRVIVPIFSPKHEATIKARYVRLPNQSYWEMVRSVGEIERAIIKAWNVIEGGVEIQIVIDDPGNMCIYMHGFPTSMGVKVEPGIVEVANIEVSLILTDRAPRKGIDVVQCTGI